jgi:hypothetical protein
MPYLGKVELKSSNIKRWTGVSGAVSAITHSTLGFIPFNEPSTFITVNGVGQHDSAFTLGLTQIDFSSAFDVLDEVEITCIIDVGQPISAADDTVGITQLKVSDGTVGQVLTTDGAGALSFSSKSTETLASMGVTSTAAELNHVSGVTSAIQTQIDTKQSATADYDVGDNVKIKLGASDDLQIFHDASDSIIKDQGTGNLKLCSDNLYLRNAADTETALRATENGAVKLYHDNAEKLATTSSGIDVTGSVNGLVINTTATSNIGLGAGAVDSITTGDYNVGLGDSAGTRITTGTGNTGVGYTTLLFNTTGSYNHAFGYGALYQNISGTQNAAFGTYALEDNTTASHNSAFGSYSLANNTTGSQQVAIGYQSLDANTTGNDNTAVGKGSLGGNTTGSANSAIGKNSLFVNTTGNYNTASGKDSLFANTTGSQNTASGYEVLKANTTGSVNSAFGQGALSSNTTGGDNTAIGRNCLRLTVTGSRNTSVGQSSFSSTTGSDNTGIGDVAGYYITTGSKNTILGRYDGNQGGLDIRTSSNNIVLSDGDGNPRVYVKSNGDCGIGTVSPTEKLDVNGTVNATAFTGDGSALTNLPIASPVVKTASYSASNNDIVIAGAGSITITLPASPSIGDSVTVKDGTGDAATTNWTVARNGSNITSSASDLIIDTNWIELRMTYINSTIGWSI